MSDVVCVLKTGAGGSGKTSSTVWELFQLQKRWDLHPDERRPIYIHGVRNLSIEHHELPVYPLHGKPGDSYRKNDRTGQPEEKLAVDWSRVPEGAHVVIDEAHWVFPVRPQGSAVPGYVQEIATARHLGWTLTLITQAPTSIDTEVRKRCVLHRHYVPFLGGLGGLRVVREWTDGVSTQLRAPTSWRLWRVPEAVHPLYSSALVHSKGQAARLPIWALVPAGALVVGAVAAPFAWKALSGAMGGQGVSSVAAPALPASSVLPSPAAVAAGLTSAAAAPAAAASVLRGCMVRPAHSRCECIDSDGFRVVLSRDECAKNAREYGYGLPYPVWPSEAAQAALSGSGAASDAPGRQVSSAAVVGQAMRNLAGVR